MPVNIFYGWTELPMTAKEINAAKAICAKCEVRRDCLIAALKRKEPYGVMGGHSAFERRAALERHKDNLADVMADYDEGKFVQPRRRRK